MYLLHQNNLFKDVFLIKNVHEVETFDIYKDIYSWKIV